jgi:hypothetical protein
MNVKLLQALMEKLPEQKKKKKNLELFVMKYASAGSREGARKVDSPVLWKGISE